MAESQDVTILVVDDSLLVRRQVTAVLERAGYDVVDAVDGEDARAKLGPHIDLVICDLNMPRMSGMELLAWILEDGTHVKIPVVMLTTEAKPGSYERAKALGARGWLMKPFRPDLMLAAIAKLVGKRAS